jgi:K+-sensing histidine kinase KdpD
MSTGASPARGRLRVYLGAAPGSGKTFAMLREGRERVAAGEDIVLGFIETYGRPRTIQAIGQLEVVPRLKIPYRGTVLEEMDLEAVLGRRPQVALVDELAHSNAPGVSHAKRWEDVEALRDAGIDVVTTVNVQHIESVKDLVEHITGIAVRETVPDRILDRADEVHFIDIAPEALRKRMRHGNIYTADKVDTALSNFFRPGNLAALREIALRMVAQRAGESRAAVRPPPQDVLVAISGSDSSEALIRRGVRIARRFGGLCTVVTVVRSQEAAHQAVSRARALADLLQCSLIVRESTNVGEEVVRVARELDTRHVVLGESLKQRPLWRRVRRSLLDRVVDDLPGVDVHLIARFDSASRGRPQSPRVAQRRRPDDLLRDLTPQRRGGLRVYVGYARGCGTGTRPPPTGSTWCRCCAATPTSPASTTSPGPPATGSSAPRWCRRSSTRGSPSSQPSTSATCAAPTRRSAASSAGPPAPRWWTTPCSASPTRSSWSTWCRRCSTSGCAGATSCRRRRWPRRCRASSVPSCCRR